MVSCDNSANNNHNSRAGHHRVASFIDYLLSGILQSQGRVQLPKRNQDGIYFGSLTGAVQGAVAGILWVRGEIVGAATASIPLLNSFAIEAFITGLALKGLPEAAGTIQVAEPPAN